MKDMFNQNIWIKQYNILKGLHYKFNYNGEKKFDQKLESVVLVRMKLSS